MTSRLLAPRGLLAGGRALVQRGFYGLADELAALPPGHERIQPLPQATRGANRAIRELVGVRLDGADTGHR